MRLQVPRAARIRRAALLSAPFVVAPFAAPLLVLGLVLVLGACSTTPHGSENSYSSSEGSNQTKAIEGNDLLERDLEIRDVRSKRENERLTVQFVLANKRSNSQSFSWAVDWFDATGFQVQDATRRWEPVQLHGFGTTVLTITAPRPEATTWQLHVTSPDEVH